MMTSRFRAVSFLLAVSLLTVSGCRSLGPSEQASTVDTASHAEHPPSLVDADATEKTRNLFGNLQRETDDAVLYGHQDDLAYGVKWWDEPGRSDVKEVTGSYPAVYGWEVGGIGHPGVTKNLDGVSFDKMRDWIREGYKRGGVITISWHMDNPTSGGRAWDTTSTISQMLPGGSLNDVYKARLNRFADFIKSLNVRSDNGVGRGTLVPVIFRPFHEMSGGWFWWGAGNVSPANYKRIWRFTVEYLRDEKDVHNLLYAYSTDSIYELDQREDYFTWYPGDDYVDILAFDDYNDLQAEGATWRLGKDLQWLVRQANERGKIPAMSETGYTRIPDSTWWTGKLLKAFKANPEARQIAYVLTWRNANEDRKEGHFFAPYPGQKSAADFKRFYNSALILFEDELPNMYE